MAAETLDGHAKAVLFHLADTFVSSDSMVVEYIT